MTLARNMHVAIRIVEYNTNSIMFPQRRAILQCGSTIYFELRRNISIDTKTSRCKNRIFLLTIHSILIRIEVTGKMNFSSYEYFYGREGEYIKLEAY